MHTFVQLIEEVASVLPGGEDVELIGCPTVTKPVFEEIQRWMGNIDTVWTPPLSTEITKDIEKIEGVAEEMATMYAMLNKEQTVPESALHAQLLAIGHRKVRRSER